MNMKISFSTGWLLHLTGSSLCRLISMTICQGDGSDVLVVKTMWCWNDLHVHLVWPFAIFSLGICEELGLCPPSSCKCKRPQTKNHYCTGDCYARYAAACLGGARLPIWRVPCNRRYTHWTFVKSFMEFTCLKIFIQTTGIILILFNIKPVEFHLIWICSFCDI